MTDQDTFHPGEIAVQTRAGESDSAARSGRAIRPRIPDGAGDFIAQQAMAIMGIRDAAGEVWASVLLGPPGFVRTIDDHRLEIDLSRARTSESDPCRALIGSAGDIGLLLIDLASRRRLRINGRIHAVTEEYCIVEAHQVYPNCPKYIQRRNLNNLRPRHPEGSAIHQGNNLDASVAALIQDSDTFFVASAHPSRGVDVSHRGGRPGFVQQLDECRLRIPDYPGNGMFNTLGNFYSYPRAGLAFIDFQRGQLLQLTGEVNILWDRNDPDHDTGGTLRYWDFIIDHWQLGSLPYHVEWTFLDYSPFNP